jgi:hypothetical protein
MQMPGDLLQLIVILLGCLGIVAAFVGLIHYYADLLDKAFNVDEYLEDPDIK